MVALKVGGQGQLLNASLGVWSSIWCSMGESVVAFVELSSSHWEKQMNWEATLNLLRAVWGSMTDVQGGTSVFLSNSCYGMTTTFSAAVAFSIL